MENKIQPLEFGILKILDCGFTIEESFLDEPNIEIGYAMHLVYDIENNWFQINVKVDFLYPQTGNVFMSGTVLTKFVIKNFINFIGEDQKLKMPSGSIEALFSIAFGHLRAILAKNSAGSRFSNIIVPIISPGPLFNELLKSNIENLKIEAQYGQVNEEDGINLFELKKYLSFFNPS
jgi:hypothetical protein